jgi:outer membrane biosynthesis protein TonB
MTSGVGRVLLTPEDYLQAHSVHFDRPAGPDPKEVADTSPTGNPAERKLAASITARERRLLAVDPAYRSPNRKVHYEGQVEMATVVGADGRLHQTRVLTSLGEHEERVMRVLPLWRYEPARRGDEPVAVRLGETAVLRIY